MTSIELVISDHLEQSDAIVFVEQVETSSNLRCDLVPIEHNRTVGYDQVQFTLTKSHKAITITHTKRINVVVVNCLS